MRPRQSLPHVWLMTDERIGEALWPALERLPHGAGVVFRHYRTEAGERRRLYERVRRITRRRRLVLVLAGTPRQAIAWRADGAHGRSPHRSVGRRLLRTAPAHDAQEAIGAARRGVDLIFVSPVFATRSHPGARTLGPIRLGGLARSIESSFPRRRESTLAAGPDLKWIPACAGMTKKSARLIALGGMNATRFRLLRKIDAYGWAAIDSLTDQKRKVVPK